MKIYTVSELNTEAREAMLLAFEYPVTVKGEVSDYRASKGHQYFKLRDSATMHTVNCVVWKNSSVSIDVSKFIHMEVVCSARVDFYAGFGQFQLNIAEISEFGDGFLKKEIEFLKKKLSDEGIFDQNRELPRFPKIIAILTAEDSHALKDVCSKLNEKYPLSHLHLYPSTVQGLQAPRNMIKQLRKINKDSAADVILIVRGGGSLQDLMAFNDESLVREIAKSNIPTITGIGHKPDITLADYAADSYQETPTAAAVKAVPDSQTIKQDILYIEELLVKGVRDKTLSYENELQRLHIIVRSKNPMTVVKGLLEKFHDNEIMLKKSIKNMINFRQKIVNDELFKRKRLYSYISQNINSLEQMKKNTKETIVKYTELKIDKFVEILKLKFQQIKQINPDEILKKGFAIIRDENKRILKNTESVSKSDGILIQMIDGSIKVFRKK